MDAVAARAGLHVGTLQATAAAVPLDDGQRLVGGRHRVAGDHAESDRERVDRGTGSATRSTVVDRHGLFALHRGGVPSAFVFISDGSQYAERSLVSIPRPQLDGLAAVRVAIVL